MTKKKLSQHHATFESIKHSDDQGNEFWLARQLANVLEYSQYRHFLPVIERAREACSNSGQAVADHIEDILTMVDIGSGASWRTAAASSQFGHRHPQRPAQPGGQSQAAHHGPHQIIENIEAQGRIVAAALVRLKSLMAASQIAE